MTERWVVQDGKGERSSPASWAECVEVLTLMKQVAPDLEPWSVVELGPQVEGHLPYCDTEGRVWFCDDDCPLRSSGGAS